MMYKLKIRFKNLINIFFNFINLNLDQSIKKQKLVKLLNKLQPYYLGHKLIRIGSDNDGGYLIPDILDQIKICFSPGTGRNTNFEKDLINRGIETFLADGTLDKNEPYLNNLNFLNKNITSFNSENTITLEDWIKNQSIKSNDMLLQMDIESSEYEVIHCTPQTVLKRFKIIIIEFHFIEKLIDSYFNHNFNNALDKLLLDFEICHIHPNNCHGLISICGIKVPTAFEVTFLRKDLSRNKEKIYNLPHNLDQKNIKTLVDVRLPKEIFNN